MLLPEDWDTMDLFQRRSFLTGSEFTGETRIGKLRRKQVSNLEIWCECLGKRKEDIRPADSYAIAAIVERIGGWERTGKITTLPIYGRQRIYRRVEQGCSVQGLFTGCSREEKLYYAG